MALTRFRTDRRQFLSGLLAASLVPRPTWADAGSPIFLSAAAKNNGDYTLCGIDSDLNLVFQVPLPSRGHAAAGHPKRPEAVAFARRPGTFAVVIDCRTGHETARLNAPQDRHFYGHGAFSADGSLLYTTENDFAAGRGCIGVWDVSNGYIRIDEWDSGGIGPHDIKRIPGSDVLVIANGGIDTHPNTGRTKLNIPSMQPNLAYVDNGFVSEKAELSEEMHKNSIRHLAVSDAGDVAFGMQWQGDHYPSALVGVHRRGAALALMAESEEYVRNADGYVGSIAFSEDGQSIAATSPRGGQVQVFDHRSRQLLTSKDIEDVSGISSIAGQFVVTSGTGLIGPLDRTPNTTTRHYQMAFDNHLIPLE